MHVCMELAVLLYTLALCTFPVLFRPDLFENPHPCFEDESSNVRRICVDDFLKWESVS